MTFLTVGRCEFDDPPERLDFDGNTLRMSGDIVAASAAEMIVRRQQVLGLIDNPDEDVFPVTFTEDPSIDGWYRVRNGGVGSRPTMFASYMIPWDLTLERLPGGSRSPQFEVYGAMILGSNAHSVTSATGLLGGVPITSEVATSTGVGLSSPSIVGSEGDTYPVVVPLVGSSAPVRGYVRYRLDPDEHYVNSARVEVLRGGTWYPVVGRQCDEVGANWRIGNGLFMVTPNDVNPNFLSYKRHDSTLSKNFRFSEETVSPAPSESNYGFSSGISILRNDPWAVIVRTSLGNLQCDLMVRAGAQHVEVVPRHLDGSLNVYGCTRTVTEAATTTTGGIKANADDADGKRYFILNPAAVTVSGQLVYRSASGGATKWALGTATNAAINAGDILNQFLVNTTAKIKVVGR